MAEEICLGKSVLILGRKVTKQITKGDGYNNVFVGVVGKVSCAPPPSLTCFLRILREKYGMHLSLL